MLASSSLSSPKRRFRRLRQNSYQQHTNSRSQRRSSLASYSYTVLLLILLLSILSQCTLDVARLHLGEEQPPSLIRQFFSEPSQTRSNNHAFITDVHHPQDSSRSRFSSTKNNATRRDNTTEFFEPALDHWIPSNDHKNLMSIQNQIDSQIRVFHPEFIAKLQEIQAHLHSIQLDNLVLVDDSQPAWSLAPMSETQSKISGTFRLPPPKLPHHTSSTINTVILIPSCYDNHLRRLAIRETWAQQQSRDSEKGIVCYFIIGQGNENSVAELDLLQKEQHVYQDIVEIPIPESYTHLPEKLIQAYAWALQHIPSVDWVVKADDDSYVRPRPLHQYLQKYNPHVPMWIGKMIPHSLVAKEGKWADLEYPQTYYPYWAIGSAGHVVSRKIVEYVVGHSASLHRYQGEDTSLGIWLHEWKNETVTYIQASSLIRNDGIGSCGVSSRYLMIGHDLNLEGMYECHLRFNKSASGVTTKESEEENTWIDEPAEFAQRVKAEENPFSGDDDTQSPLLENGGRISPNEVNNLPPVARGMRYAHPASLRGHLAKSNKKEKV